MKFIFTLLLTIIAINSQAGQIEYDAGACVGGIAVLKQKSIKSPKLSPQVIKSMESKIIPVMANESFIKWEEVKNQCITSNATGSVNDMQNCMDKNIPDKKAASYWKGWINTFANTFGNSDSDAIKTTDKACLSFVKG